MMADIGAAANDLAANNLPVLFLDTCILLDVIRAIKRRFGQCIEHAFGLHAAATASPIRCRLAVSHIVKTEWNAKESGLLDEARRHLTEIQEQSGHFHDACGVLGVAPGFGRANYGDLGVAERMRDLSRELLDCALVIDSDDECSGRAIHRVIHGIPPSRQGGEAKDCTIIEEYLAVCRRLHAAGFSRKLVFCTSNTNDYCHSGSALHPQLAAEFASVGLRFTANLNWGFHDVTH